MEKEYQSPNNWQLEKPTKIPAVGSWLPTVHVFEEKPVWAIIAAVISKRPLLIRGEPGVGKSQLARAVAHKLNRNFICEVVHARSESQDLLWSFDNIARLGEAQALVACKDIKETDTDTHIKNKLNPTNFLSPGPLWWALNWSSAKIQAGKCSHVKNTPQEQPANKKGCVLLIDEIDKAEADLPNGLLETLDNKSFSVPYFKNPITLQKETEDPLVIITTNEERELPAAFLRRCMVLQMELPKNKDDLVDYLVKRGEYHFGAKCERKIRKTAAELLWADRKQALKQNLPAPGQAEYLDMLRVLSVMKPEKQEDALKAIAPFALRKYPQEDSI